MTFYVKGLLVFALLFASACEAEQQPLWVFQAGQPIESASMFDDNKKVAVLTQNDIQILDVKTGKKIKHISGELFGRFPDSRTAVHVIVCKSSICWVGGGEHRFGFLARVNINAEVGNYIESDSFAEIFGMAIGQGQEIVTAHGDSSAIVWDGGKLQSVKSTYLSGGLENWAVHFDGNSYFLGNDNGELAIWNGKSNAPQRRFLVEQGIKDSYASIFAITSINGFIVVGGAGYLDFINKKDRANKRHIEFKQTAVLSCDTSTNVSLTWCGLLDGGLVSISLDGKIESSTKLYSKPIIFVKALPEIVITASKDGVVKAHWAMRLNK